MRQKKTPARDALLAFILRHTVASRVKDEVEADRADRLEALLALRDDTGADRVEVTLPSGHQVATLSLVKPKAREDVDQEKVLAWAREHHPDLVERIHHDPVPAYTEERVDMTAVRALGLTSMPDGTVVTADGEVVPGMTVTTPPVRSFTVRYAPGGQEAVLAAWQGGDLGHLTMGHTLPALEADQ